MASSNIKLFDENKGNMLSDSEFNISTQRLNGLQTGVASSQLQNKAMYQASLVAYAIAQVMMQNGKNANDTDAVSAFVANLSGAMLQKVYDIATTAEAQAGVATGKWMSPALTKAFFDYRKATTSEAQNATDNTKWMSPALVRAAFNYIKATTAEAQEGTNDTKWMSPALVKAAINYVFGNSKATTSEAQAGTNDTKWMSPALVKAAIDTLAAKAQNILSDETKALFGLDVTAVPDDVFALINQFQNGIGNQYVWEKYEDIVVSIAVKSNVSQQITIPQEGSQITVYTTANVVDGAIVLSGQVKVGLNYASGYYVYYNSKEYYLAEFVTNDGATVYYKANPLSIGETTVQKLIGYVNSFDANAYPPAVSDGYTYKPLGRLGANVHIAIGNYAGTNTYGRSNPNRLTFDFEPKVLFIYGFGHNGNDIVILTIDMNGQKIDSPQNSFSSEVSFASNSVSWYSSSGASYQFNYAGNTYYYCAIG